MGPRSVYQLLDSIFDLITSSVAHGVINKIIILGEGPQSVRYHTSYAIAIIPMILRARPVCAFSELVHFRRETVLSRIINKYKYVIFLFIFLFFFSFSLLVCVRISEMSRLEWVVSEEGAFR